MPTCRLCLRNFTKWRQLKLHIERKSCPQLGGQSHKLSPLQPDNAALRHLPGNKSQAPTDYGDEPAAPKEPRVLPDELPLVLRPSFIDNLSRWEKLLSCPDTKALLSSHCALCHMWIADTKHIRQHYNKVHHASHPHILPAALEVSKSFKSQLARGRACRWCRSTVGAPGRHSTQCIVLNQLTVAVEYCKQGLHHPHHDHGGPRGEYLRPLHALGDHYSNSRYDGPASDRPPHQSSPSLPHFQKTSRPGLGTPTAAATATSLPSPAVPAHTGNGASDRPLVSSRPETRRALHNLRKDMAYVLFFRQDDKSLVPSLMEVAKEWRERAATATPDPALHSPLRTVLINCLLKELLQRTQRVTATEAGRADLQKMGWLDIQGHWNYLKWSPQQRRLVLNEARSPVTHDTMVKTITELQASMSGDVIHRFKSKQPMWAIEEEGHSQAVFDLEISLRSTTADEVHMNFGVLAGNAVTNLVGMTMKRDDRPRQPQAQQLAQLVYPGRQSPQNLVLTRIRSPYIVSSLSPINTTPTPRMSESETTVVVVAHPHTQSPSTASLYTTRTITATSTPLCIA